MRTLRAHNPNDVTGRDKVDWSANVSWNNLRFMPYNGAIGGEQLAWLHAQLNASARDNVVIFSHVPLYPRDDAPMTLLWNYEQVLEEVFRARSRVLAVFSGHEHEGGYVRSVPDGVHHITVPSPLEGRGSELNSFVILRAYEDRLEVEGHGAAPSFVIDAGLSSPTRERTRRRRLVRRHRHVADG